LIWDFLNVANNRAIAAGPGGGGLAAAAVVGAVGPIQQQNLQLAQMNGI